TSKFTNKKDIYVDYDSNKDLYAGQGVVYFKRSGTVAQPKTDITIPLYQQVEITKGDIQIRWVGDLKTSIKKNNYRGLEGGNLNTKFQGILRDYTMVKKIEEIVQKKFNNNSIKLSKMEVVRCQANSTDVISLKDIFDDYFANYGRISDHRKMFFMYKLLMGEISTYGVDQKKIHKYLDIEANSFLVVDKGKLNTNSVKEIFEQSIFITPEIANTTALGILDKDENFIPVRDALTNMLKNYGIGYKIGGGSGISYAMGTTRTNQTDATIPKLLEYTNFVFVSKNQDINKWMMSATVRSQQGSMLNLTQIKAALIKAKQSINNKKKLSSEQKIIELRSAVSTIIPKKIYRGAYYEKSHLSTSKLLQSIVSDIGETAFLQEIIALMVKLDNQPDVKTFKLLNSKDDLLGHVSYDEQYIFYKKA
ncbi:MAG: hypothetical protein ACRC6B_09430, partial [Fusobacteriaceae bacterium]